MTTQQGAQPQRRARKKIRDYAQLMRLDKPIGIYLLLWPTLWALWLAADGVPHWHVLLVFVLGTVLMRSAGCAINDFADRDFDPHVERTQNRPLAAGRMRAREALALFVGVSMLALVLTLTLRNAQVLLLALPGALLAGVYPFAKRAIAMPQAVLGLAFSWGIPMAYAAVGGAVNWDQALLLMTANVCWVIAYDTYYAMADRADDLKIGVKSSAILFGRYDRAMVAGLHLAALFLLYLLGARAQLGAWYDTGLFVALLLAMQQWWATRARDPQACFAAFLHNNRLGLAIFIGLALDLALK